MSSVSVVIPVYRSAFVREAIQSALQQTLPPLEIILVDSSPETTLTQIDDCVNFVRQIAQPPCGVSHARNAGTVAAQGDYIAFLDADDLWLPDKLKVQVALLERYPEAGFCFSTTWNLVTGDGAGIPKEPYFPPELLAWKNSNRVVDGAVFGDVHGLLLSANCVATSSVVAKKAALVGVGLFDESIKNGEDYDLWLRLSSEFPAIYLCEPASRYRVHGDGLSGSWNSRSELFYRANIRVLEKHQMNAPSPMTKKALARTLADFAGFKLRQAQRQEARHPALRSFWLWPNRAAAQFYIEATWPRLFSVAARVVRATLP